MDKLKLRDYEQTPDSTWWGRTNTRMLASSQAAAKSVTALTFAGSWIPGKYLNPQINRVHNLSTMALDVLVLRVDDFAKLSAIDYLFVDPEPNIWVNLVRKRLHITSDDLCDRRSP